jgi:hypothetical protein
MTLHYVGQPELERKQETAKRVAAMLAPAANQAGAPGLRPDRRPPEQARSVTNSDTDGSERSSLMTSTERPDTREYGRAASERYY